MALNTTAELSFSVDQVTLTNTTGAYNVSTNPGGYGAPNTEFTDLAHYAIIRKKNVNEVADSVLTLDAYNPITAVEFTADRDPDGWYEGTTMDIPIWSSLTAYTGGTLVTGSAVYYAGTVYVCTVDGTNRRPDLFPSDWATISDLTTIEDNTTIITTVVGDGTAYDADVYWSKQIADNSQRGNCGVCEDDKLKLRLDTILRYIHIAKVSFRLGNNTDGEWAVLRLRELGAKKATA